MATTKEQRTEYMKKWYELHKEERKAHMRAYAKAHREEFRERGEKWCLSHQREIEEYRKAFRPKSNKYMREKYATDPKTRERSLAYRKTYRALEKGEIKKTPCEICGKKKVEMHHSDYNKPLEVRWLCREHHMRWHENNTPIYSEGEY